MDQMNYDINSPTMMIPFDCEDDLSMVFSLEMGRPDTRLLSLGLDEREFTVKEPNLNTPQVEFACKSYGLGKIVKG